MHAVITSGLWLHMRYQCQGENMDLKRELCNGSTFQDFFTSSKNHVLSVPAYFTGYNFWIICQYNRIRYNFYIYNNYRHRWSVIEMH